MNEYNKLYNDSIEIDQKVQYMMSYIRNYLIKAKDKILKMKKNRHYDKFKQEDDGEGNDGD